MYPGASGGFKRYEDFLTQKVNPGPYVPIEFQSFFTYKLTYFQSPFFFCRKGFVKNDYLLDIILFYKIFHFFDHVFRAPGAISAQVSLKTEVTGVRAPPRCHYCEKG